MRWYLRCLNCERIVKRWTTNDESLLFRTQYIFLSTARWKSHRIVSMWIYFWEWNSPLMEFTVVFFLSFFSWKKYFSHLLNWYFVKHDNNHNTKYLILTIVTNFDSSSPDIHLCDDDDDDAVELHTMATCEFESKANLLQKGMHFATLKSVCT